MERLSNWKTFVFELLLYAVLLVAYFAFVLHYLGGWFKDIDAYVAEAEDGKGIGRASCRERVLRLV